MYYYRISTSISIRMAAAECLITGLRRYGRDKVAQCVIYGTIKTKQALKDSARIMGYEFSMGERITSVAAGADGWQGYSVARYFRADVETLCGGS